MLTPKSFCALAGLAMILVGSGCGKGGAIEPGPVPTTAHAKLLFFNAAPAAPAMDLAIDTRALIAGQTFGSIPSGDVEVDTGMVHAKAFPTGTTNVVDRSMALADGEHYTLFAVNDTLNSFDLVLFHDNLTTPPEGKAAIRIANLIPDTSPVSLAFSGSGLGAIFSDVDFKDTTEHFILVDAQNVTMRALNTGPAGKGNGNGTGGGNKVKHSMMVDVPIALGSGRIYTIAFVGRLADSSARMVVITHTKTTSVAN